MNAPFWNMKIFSRKVFFLLNTILGVFLMPEHSAAAENDLLENISVHIVPTNFRETGGKIIQLSDSSQHFHVVVTNSGKNPLRFWQERCSWGYGSVSFELKEKTGEKKIIKKAERAWEKNFPDWRIVPPGESMVFEVAFEKAVWENFPVVKSGESINVELAAVFEIKDSPEAKSNTVWTGRVASPKENYKIFR